MKKIMFALYLVFGGFVVVSAQDSTSISQDRVRIQSTELPDAVKRSLEGQEYRGWLVNGAFTAKAGSDEQAMEADSTSIASDTTSKEATQEESTNAAAAQAEEIYIVELKNGAETKTISFDKDGKKIEGMEEGQDQNIQAEPTTPAEPATPAEPTTPAEPEIEKPDPATPNDQKEESTPKKESAPKDPK